MTDGASEQDGTFYYGNLSDLHAPGAIAYWSRRLAPAYSGERLIADRPMLENPQNRFGGWHPDVTMFLLGDGSARALRNDTANTS